MQCGCLVVNAPTANTVAAAEHGIALICALSRNVAQADASVKRGEWKRSQYTGVSLVNKTLAIMGFGKVQQNDTYSNCIHRFHSFAYYSEVRFFSRYLAFLYVTIFGLVAPTLTTYALLSAEACCSNAQQEAHGRKSSSQAKLFPGLQHLQSTEALQPAFVT